MSTTKSSSKPLYVNLMSDFGFKRIFGEEESKPLLIDFLNALFEGDIIVDDVVYDNVEQQPDTKDARGIRYDVFCHIPSSEKGKKATHHFIIEMQNDWQRNFDQRGLYYRHAPSRVKDVRATMIIHWCL